MPNNYNGDEFIAGPCNHYHKDYQKAVSLIGLVNTTKDPDEVVLTGGTGANAATQLVYAGDTEAATTFTPTTTTRDRTTQQHNVVESVVQTQGGTVTTSYDQMTLEKLARAWHCEILPGPTAGTRILRPLGKMRFITLVVDGAGVKVAGVTQVRRFIFPKVANTGEAAVTYDTENNQLLAVTWTVYTPDNVDAVAGESNELSKAYALVEGPPTEDD